MHTERDAAAEDSARLDAIREATRRFAEERIKPVANELDETEAFPRELYAECAQLGLFGITVPEDSGGAGADVRTYAAVVEELVAWLRVGGRSVRADRADRHVARRARIARATRDNTWRRRCVLERRCAYALTEAQAGSDLAGLKSTAMRDGSGWRLTGQKLWIHNAPVADFALVLARTDPDAGHRGMSIFVVDLDPPRRVARQEGTQDGAARIAGRRAVSSTTSSCRMMPCSGRKAAAFTS